MWNWSGRPSWWWNMQNCDGKQGTPSSLSNQRTGDFPGAPAAESPSSPSWGPGFHPWSGNYNPTRCKKSSRTLQQGSKIPWAPTKIHRDKQEILKKKKQSTETTFPGIRDQGTPAWLVWVTSEMRKSKADFPGFAWKTMSLIYFHLSPSE